MKRWIKKRARQFGRSIAAIVICSIVVLPVFLSIKQWSGITRADSRKAVPLPAFVEREADKQKSPPKLFKEPLISVTFDDGWETTYTVVMPMLQNLGIRSTQYVLSGMAEDPGYLSWEQISAIKQNGHQIACHSINHPDLTALGPEDLKWQLTDCRNQLSSRYGPIRDFASPYGDYNEYSLGFIKQQYRSQRNTDGSAVNGVNEADVNVAGYFNPYNIIGVTIRRDTSIEELKKLIDYTKANNGWLVLTYHQADEGSSEYGLDPVSLKTQLSYISKTPVRIVTVEQVLNAYGDIK